MVPTIAQWLRRETSNSTLSALKDLRFSVTMKSALENCRSNWACDAEIPLHAGLAGEVGGVVSPGNPPLNRVREGCLAVMAVFDYGQKRHLLELLHLFHIALDCNILI